MAMVCPEMGEKTLVPYGRGHVDMVEVGPDGWIPLFLFQRIPNMVW